MLIAICAAYSKYVDWCYAEYLLCRASFMLNVENNPLMMSVVMLCVILMSVGAPFKLSTKWHVGKMTGHQTRINTNRGQL
jgi:hypothetical protein